MFVQNDDPAPAKVFVELANLEGTTLCFASHDRMPPAPKLMHSVGSALIEHAQHLLVLVGPNASAESPGSDVVVAGVEVFERQPEAGRQLREN